MIEAFLELLGYVPKRKADKALQDKYKQANLAYKESYNVGYNDGVNEAPHKFDTSRKVLPETIVLFIKAERGATLLDVLRNNNSLKGINADQLVSDVIRVWLGTNKKFQTSRIPNLFGQKDEVSTIGREYDSVAVKLPYPKCAEIVDEQSDSFSIGQVIRKACEQALFCEEISNRLPFQKIESLSLIQL